MASSSRTRLLVVRPAASIPSGRARPRQCAGSVLAGLHGGKGGGPLGERNGAYRHGRQTQVALAERRDLARGRAELQAIMRAVKEWEDGE